MEDVRSRIGFGDSFRYYRERTDDYDEDGEDIDDDEEEEDSESDEEEWPAEKNKEKDAEETDEESQEEEEEEEESEQQLAPEFELLTFQFNKGEKLIRGMWCHMQHEGRAIFLRVHSKEEESSHTADEPETAKGDDGDEDEVRDVVDVSGTDGGGDDDDDDDDSNVKSNLSTPKTRRNEKLTELMEPASSPVELETEEGLEQGGVLLEERQLTSTTDEVLDGKTSKAKPLEKTMPTATSGVASLSDTAHTQTQDTE